MTSNTPACFTSIFGRCNVESKAGTGEVETGEFACTDKGLTKGNTNVRVEQRRAAGAVEELPHVFEGSIPVPTCLCIWMCLGHSWVWSEGWDAVRAVGSMLCLGQEHRSSVVFSALVQKSGMLSHKV